MKVAGAESSSPAERRITFAWAALVVSIPFQRVFDLPIAAGSKFQPPELAAVLLILLAAWDVWTRLRQGPGSRPRIGFAWTDLGAIAWWLAVAIAALISMRHGGLLRDVVLEVLGTTLLVFVYAALRITATPARLRVLVRAFVWMAILAGLAALAGSVLALAGVRTHLVWDGTVMPYFGAVPRGIGFTPSPAMVGSLVMTGTFAWLVAPSHRDPRRVLGLLVALAAMYLAIMAKVVVALASGLGAAWAGMPRLSLARRTIAVTIATAMAALYAIASHVVITETTLLDTLRQDKYAYVSGAPLATWTFADRTWAASASSYTFNKRASLLAIRETWPAGLGPGGHPGYALRLMREGRHPKTMWDADPHCTYTGTAAELGLVGILGLLAFASALIADVVALRRRSVAGHAVSALLAGALIAVGVEAVTTDVMNFRHYWVAAAALASLAATASVTRTVQAKPS